MNKSKDISYMVYINDIFIYIKDELELKKDVPKGFYFIDARYFDILSKIKIINFI